ncbi:MAG: hypothetical protein QXU97_05500 [Fervidicoccaceae archaeon]
MLKLRRHAGNPILTPRADFWLEGEAVFNPTVIKRGEKVVMLYRALSRPLQRSPEEHIKISTIMRAESSDGVSFERRGLFIGPERPWEAYATEDPRVTRVGSTYFITYTAVSRWPPRPESVRLALALSEDLVKCTKVGVICPYNSKAGFVFPRKYEGRYLMALTLNPDRPPSSVVLVAFDDVRDLLEEEFWRGALSEAKALLRGTSEKPFVELGTPPLEVDDHWLLFLPDILYEKGHFVEFSITAALLRADDPSELVALSTRPLLRPELEYELTQNAYPRGIAFPSGALLVGDEVWVYYGAADKYVALARVELARLLDYLLRECRVGRAG